jgi:hypothetical protein
MYINWFTIDYNKYVSKLNEYANAMLGGSLVTTVWCILRLRMEEDASK